jgi:hypothetical protein
MSFESHGQMEKKIVMRSAILRFIIGGCLISELFQRNFLDKRSPIDSNYLIGDALKKTRILMLSAIINLSVTN